MTHNRPMVPRPVDNAASIPAGVGNQSENVPATADAVPFNTEVPKASALASTGVSRRTIMTTAAFALATLQPSMSEGSDIRSPDEVLNNIWLARKLKIAEVRRLNGLVEQLEDSLPCWALPGFSRIDGDGNYCGEISKWPERADIDELERGRGWQVRPSPRESHRLFQRQCKFLKGEERAAARARHRILMRNMIARVREQRQLRERIGLSALERQIDKLHSEIEEMGRIISDSPETALKAGALCLYYIVSEASLADTIADTHGNWGLDLAYGVLRSIERLLTGAIGEDAQKLVSAPEYMRIEELDFAPA